MYPTFAGDIAAQRIVVLHQQAARQRLVRRLRAVGAASPVNGRVQASCLTGRALALSWGGAVLR
jgi:hypothetical protein